MDQPNVLTKNPIEKTEAADTSSQGDSSLYSLPYWLGIGEFFLVPENINKKYEGYWDYDKIYSLLRSWASEINPNLDENPSLSDIIKTLRDPENSQTIQKSNSVDLEQLDYLIKKLEEANVVSKESADLARQIKKAFMDSLVRKAETENNYLSFLKTAVQKLTTSPIESAQIGEIAKVISQSLEINQIDFIEAIKTRNSTETEAVQNLSVRQTEIWEAAVVKAVVKLERDGVHLNEDQINYLKTVSPDFIFYRIIELQEKEAKAKIELKTIKPDVEKVVSVVKEALTPTDGTRGTIEPLQRDIVAKAIVESLERDQVFLEGKQKEFLERTIDQAATQLNNKGIQLTQEQITYLKTVSGVVWEQITQTQDQGILYKSPNIDKIIPIVEGVLRPIPSDRLKIAATQTARLVFVNTQPAPEISPKTATAQDIRDIQIRIKNEAILSLSQIAPSLVEKGIVLTPIETARLLAIFSSSENEVRNSLGTPFLNEDPFNKARILQSNNQGLIEVTKNFPAVNSFIARFSPFYLKIESGKALGASLKDSLFRLGINKDSVHFLEEQMGRLKIFETAASGLTPAVLEKALNLKIRLGLSPESPEGKELAKLIPALRKYLLENPQIQKRLRGLEKIGIYLLPRSENGTLISVQKSTVILTIASTLLTKAKPLLGNLFGKTNVKFINTALFITNSRFSFVKKGLENFGRDFLFNTKTGKSIFKFFQGDRQDFLQNLFSMNFPSREGLNIPNINFGRTISRIGDTSISARTLRFIANKGYDLLVSQNSIITRFIGTTQNFINHVTNTSLAPKNMAKWAFLLVGVILVFQFMSLTIIGGALVSKGGSDEGSREGGSSPLPPQCQNTRHLAETVICAISYADSPCNQKIINISTWQTVNRCFSSTTLPNKEILRSWFDRYHSRYTDLYGTRFDNFQCLEFVLGVQEANGQSLSMSRGGTARDYVHSYPSTYRPFFSDPRPGDIAVWDGDPGHIAVVLGTDGSKIIVAQANSASPGEINVASRPGIIGRPGPAVYLRFR